MIAIRAVFKARALGEPGLWKVIVSRRKWSNLRGRGYPQRGGDEVQCGASVWDWSTSLPFPLHRWGDNGGHAQHSH